ncbi:MAG: TlpA family protein disulfide reductase [Methylococcaceae bacterium]
MKTSKGLSFLLPCVLLVCALSACDKRQGLQIGDSIPTVKLTDFQGKSVTLPADIKGKVALLRFWSLECGFCDKDIILALEPLYQKYKNQGFVPVAINESRAAAGDERLKKFDRLTYPMLVDEYGRIAKQFGVIGLPTTFIIDEEGIVREKLTGEAGIEEFEKLFTTVLYKGGFYENGH